MSHSLTHQYFLACAQVWREYFNGTIGMATRDRLIRQNRDFFFGRD